MPDDLKRALPCPWCSGTDLRIGNPDGIEVWVNCNDCEASGPQEISERLAVDAWNRRAGFIETGAQPNNIRSMPCEHRHYHSGGFGKPDICDDCGEDL